jgi:hypothetical protein
LKCIHGDFERINVLSLYEQRDLQGGNALAEVFVTFGYPPVLETHALHSAEHAKRCVRALGCKDSSTATLGELLGTFKAAPPKLQVGAVDEWLGNLRPQPPSSDQGNQAFLLTPVPPLNFHFFVPHRKSEKTPPPEN